MSDAVEIIRIDRPDEFPDWTNREELETFLHEKMRPYHDEIHDVRAALDYAFSEERGMGGFVLLARVNGKLGGSLVMLHTAMKGYIPENLLVFVGVDPDLRGRGIGGKLVKRGIDESDGNVKLHVESDNPAKRLYLRVGFEHKYDELRFTKS